jgi:hypothetical protein
MRALRVPGFMLLAATFLSGVVRGEDSSSLRAIFADPPREYATGPLWTWNDLLTEQQVVATLRDLAAQKVRQVWVHPQPGLMTPYLSADWFRLWQAALDEAKKLDVNVWMYDENSYPSGFAGGYVPEASGRYFVELSVWLGSVAKVTVNGKPAGYVAWRPWQCDVTERIQPGRNTIEVIVIGTLRNTLGPHHAGPPKGIVTPHMFNQAPASGPPPGRQYSTIGYGLFQPFLLKNLK